MKVSVGAGPINLAWHVYYNHYQNPRELSEALAPIFNAEMKELVAAGANYLQLEDLGVWLPLFTGNNDDFKWIVDVIRQCVDGVDAKIGLHFCYGNAWGNRLAGLFNRRLRGRRCPTCMTRPVDQYVLDFANRDMVDLDSLRDLPSDKEVGIGVIDVRTSMIETPQEVAERIRKVTAVVPAERVHLTTDCGMKPLARPVARMKLAGPGKRRADRAPGAWRKAAGGERVNRSDQRILTTHTGSLIRPLDVLDLAQRARDGNESDQAAYAERLREAVAEVVRKQREVGIDVVSDGEFGKSSWAAYILERLTGFEIRPDQLMPLVWLGRDRERFADFFAESDMPGALRGAPTEVCVGPITYQGESTLQRDLANFQSAVKRRQRRGVLHRGCAREHRLQRHQRVLRQRPRLRVRHRRGAASGVPGDSGHGRASCRWTMPCWPTCTTTWSSKVPSATANGRSYASTRSTTRLEGIPQERVRYHVCFGSWHVPHVADAPLEDIIDFILQVKAGAYSIEAANPRHEHEWRIWETRKLPPGQILIPGVITHHLTTVEHPRLVADRIIRFARLVGRENVIAGTDCGFAQSQGTRRVHPSVMWAKFESLVEGARIATRELWS